MQGTHKEGEYRQLECWTWKSYVRLPILHNSKWAETLRRIFMEYLRIIGANNYQRGSTRCAQLTWRARAPRRAMVGCALLDPPTVPLFWYISHFDLEKKSEEDFRDEAPPSWGGTWAGALLPSGAIPPGELPSRRGKSSSSSSQTTLPSWWGQSPSTSFASTISSQTLVHILYSILLPEL